MKNFVLLGLIVLWPLFLFAQLKTFQSKNQEDLETKIKIKDIQLKNKAFVKVSQSEINDFIKNPEITVNTYGLVKPLNLNSIQNGEWQNLKDGTRNWHIQINAPEQKH
jgi:hypothetical protein